MPMETIGTILSIHLFMCHIPPYTPTQIHFLKFIKYPTRVIIRICKIIFRIDWENHSPPSSNSLLISSSLCCSLSVRMPTISVGRITNPVNIQTCRFCYSPTISLGVWELGEVCHCLLPNHHLIVCSLDMLQHTFLTWV